MAFSTNQRPSSNLKTNLSEPIGAFASPGYPNNYPDNTECSWKIEADPSEVISLEFSKYDVEEHYDLIKIQSTVTGVTKDIGQSFMSVTC